MPQSENQKASVAVVAKFLVSSLQDAFKIQASTQIEIKKVEAVPPSLIADISLLSSIGIKSSSFQGFVALYFPAQTFLGVVNRMLGENYQTITNENADAAGELMNILYASARVKINETGNDFLPAIPTVVKGNDVGMMHGGVPLVVRIDCQCEFGPFFMEVSLRGK